MHVRFVILLFFGDEEQKIVLKVQCIGLRHKRPKNIVGTVTRVLLPQIDYQFTFMNNLDEFLVCIQYVALVLLEGTLLIFLHSPSRKQNIWPSQTI